MNQIPYDPMRYRPERGLRAKIKSIDDWEVPEELKEMIDEIHLMEDILGENNDKC